MNHHPRPMTGPELSALSAYLPEDLTPDQLEDVLTAASYALAQAHSAGYTTGQTITAMRHHAQAEHRRREQATTLDQAVDADERAQAWETILQHPALQDALAMDGKLVDNVLATLSRLYLQPGPPR